MSETVLVKTKSGKRLGRFKRNGACRVLAEIRNASIMKAQCEE